MLVIPTTLEIRKIIVQGYPRQKVSKTHLNKQDTLDA
jgi:hypothetical protein